jgi:hypothetical protein
MTTRDSTTITTIGVLMAALTATLYSAGVDVPLWIPALAPLVVAIALFALRAYVAYVGADNTSVDERLAQAQDLLDSAREAIENARHQK